MLVSPPQKQTTTPLWMLICKTRQRCFLICMPPCKTAMIWLVLNALTAQAKLGCVHFSRIYSINSLIKSRKLKLYQGHGISA